MTNIGLRNAMRCSDKTVDNLFTNTASNQRGCPSGGSRILCLGGLTGQVFLFGGLKGDIGRVDAFGLEGRVFESCYSRHARYLGQVLHLQLPVALRVVNSVIEISGMNIIFSVVCGIIGPLWRGGLFLCKNSCIYA